jgi:hypothetical protein
VSNSDSAPDQGFRGSEFPTPAWASHLFSQHCQGRMTLMFLGGPSQLGRGERGVSLPPGRPGARASLKGPSGPPAPDPSLAKWAGEACDPNICTPQAFPTTESSTGELRSPQATSVGLLLLALPPPRWQTLKKAPPPFHRCYSRGPFTAPLPAPFSRTIAKRGSPGHFRTISERFHAHL